MTDLMTSLLTKWRSDPGGSYRTWFRQRQREKSFRAARHGISVTATRIEAGTFGNTYRGSPLAAVVRLIAEQGHFLRGLESALWWKPKERTPDIYENPDNQRAFGRLLDVCLRCNSEHQIVAAIRKLEAADIRGIGPSIVNLLYFLHPTLLPPYSTTIVGGFNALTGAAVRPGRWDHYLAMREQVIALNNQCLPLLSPDLGAIGALLFDLGIGRYPAPPRNSDVAARTAWEADLAGSRIEGLKMKTRLEQDSPSHTDVQGWLRDLGIALGYDVFVARNDHHRPLGGGKLGDGCLSSLPDIEPSIYADVVKLIDVLWLDATAERIVAAFEVEHTTSITSGIVRMLTLAFGPLPHALEGLFIVVPDRRETEVRTQSAYPAFRLPAGPELRYLRYSDLESNREALGRFGTGVRALKAIGRLLSEVS